MATNVTSASAGPEVTSRRRIRPFRSLWGLGLCFYLLEYATRSAPAVMIAVTALKGPIFADLLGKGFPSTANHVAHFRAGGLFWIAGIALAMILSAFLRETGHARRT